MEILLGLTNVNHKWDVISQQHESATTRQCTHLMEKEEVYPCCTMRFWTLYPIYVKFVKWDITGTYTPIRCERVKKGSSKKFPMSVAPTSR